MKQTKYFRTHDEAQAFAAGLTVANDGHLHEITVRADMPDPDPHLPYIVTWVDENKKAAELPEKNLPLTSQEYVQRQGIICPVCHGSEVEGHSIYIGNAQAFQEVTCNNPDCEASWTDCYELSGYDNLEY